MEPDELRYTAEHEWVRLQGDIAVVGITDYAQRALGDIVYVSLPAAGAQLAGGTACGEVESTKSVSDLYAPMDGSVIETNTALDSAPESLNADPYGSGWLFRMNVADPSQVGGLLSAAEYRALTESA